MPHTTNCYQETLHRIKIPFGAAVRIAEELGVSRFTVYNALSGKVNSLSAHQIRTLALNKYYGQEYK